MHMKAKTKYAKEDIESLIISILQSNKKPMTFNALLRETDEEMFTKFNRHKMKIHYYLKKLVENGEVEKKKEKNNTLYS